MFTKDRIILHCKIFANIPGNVDGKIFTKTHHDYNHCITVEMLIQLSSFFGFSNLALSSHMMFGLSNFNAVYLSQRCICKFQRIISCTTPISFEIT